MTAAPPLIVTLSLDQVSHEYFTKLRTEYFPAHCNYLDAHITLFHHLPAGIPGITEALKTLSKRSLIKLDVAGIKNIGKGVAYIISSQELLALHKKMQSVFDVYLISQDRNKLWPHITVQNKVTAYKAKQTEQILIQTFKPFSIQGIGFSVWIYRNGPWEHVNNYLFG